MLTATLPESTVSIKGTNLNPDSDATLIVNDGVLVIRLRVSGIDSVEIQTDESEVEAQLSELWASVRPALDVALVGLR